jgi:phosphoribosylformylglycinamidine synthase
MRTTMQVGDPFMGKLLLEACLELFSEDVLEGIQDMGAAGLTSSSVEMAGRADNGVEIDLDCVPRRAAAMTPYEILLSESQERMLLVANPEQAERVLAICARWELDAAVIGKVTDTKRWVVKATPGYDPLRAESKPGPRQAEIVCDIPIHVLTEGAPCYDRPRAPAVHEHVEPEPAAVSGDLGAELLDLIGSPNIGSRAWVWRQYDQIVRGGTVVRSGSDAAVVRVPCEVAGAGGPETLEKFLAFAVDCNARMCELDPMVGGAMAIAEVCRNVVCSGAEPIGITDCLNFGNPERPEVMDSFARAVDGIAAACRALDVPIVSGNVSLYNETTSRREGSGVSETVAILPTPTVAAVGLFRGLEDVVTAAFKRPGDAVILLGEAAGGSLGGSEWLVRKTGSLGGAAPRIDLGAEGKLQRLVLDLARRHLLQSAHDASDGGLAVALAECCTVAPDRVGARIDLPGQASAQAAAAALFGEGPTRVVISVASSAADQVLSLAAGAGVPAARIGQTGGEALALTVSPLPGMSVAIAELASRREACLEAIVGAS